MSTGPQDAAREDRVNEIIAAYLRAVQMGDQPDRQELLRRHPDLAADLKAFFADQDQFNRLAAALRALVPTQETTGPAPAAAADRLAPGAKVAYLGDYEVLEE